MQVAHLRKALGERPGGGEWIETVPTVGYRFVPAASTGPGIAARRVPTLMIEPFAGADDAGLAAGAQSGGKTWSRRCRASARW